MAAKRMVLFPTLLFALLCRDGSADAGFIVCNDAKSKVGVAVGYKDPEGWASEGWWNIAPGGCETLINGKLIARYYYIRGVNYDSGEIWAGRSFMCTHDKVFTIRGLENCVKRGYRRSGFLEVDTGEATEWTIHLPPTGVSAHRRSEDSAPSGKRHREPPIHAR